MEDLTHINEQGRARMVDVSEKNITLRTAEAYGVIHMGKETVEMIKSGGIKKGDVLAVAQVGGIMAAKRTSDIIPMCHPINTTGIDISFNINSDNIQGRNRCRNGGAYGCIGGGSYYIRYVQGIAEGYGDKRDKAHKQNRRKER